MKVSAGPGATAGTHTCVTCSNPPPYMYLPGPGRVSVALILVGHPCHSEIRDAVLVHFLSLLKSVYQETLPLEPQIPHTLLFILVALFLLACCSIPRAPSDQMTETHLGATTSNPVKPRTVESPDIQK